MTTRRVRHIWDFRDQDIFPEVLTRTGAAVFQRDKANTFPIDYKILDRQTWTTSFAAPIGEATAPLSIFSNATELDQIKAAAPITVRSDQKPRQGLAQTQQWHPEETRHMKRGHINGHDRDQKCQYQQ